MNAARSFLAGASAALALPGAAAAQAPALSHDPLAHHQRTFHMAAFEVDHALDEEALAWEADAWIGGDDHKLWLKSEGETHDGRAEAAEVQALYSRRISTFFDAQAGVRYDFEPRETAYLVLGLQGLAPYQFETEAAAFLSERGDVSLRLAQSLDLRLTQRLILEPEIELEAYAQDVAALDVGAGIAEVEASLQLRYEVTRRFAPYVTVSYGRRLGETAGLARRAGEDPEESAVRLGVRGRF